MSFLFVDQVGSTAQLARLGDDDARPVRQALFDLLTGAVERHGGEVVDNTGDGVMAVFTGARAALDAAVSMQEAATRHNRDVASDGAIHLRVGVHTGEVAADEQGRWFGMPVVVAARLCARAGTGEVWTSALVAALVEGGTDCTFEDLGPLELKGVGAPVPTVAVRWPSHEPEAELPARMIVARRTPLAGRQRELARMRTTWQSTVDGSRRLLLVSGEPGIGKSRLVAEAAHDAAAGGAVVVEGGCDEQLPVPFRPFVGAVRQLLERVGEDAVTQAVGRPPTALARIVPEVLGGSPPPSTDPQAERLALFEEIDTLFATSGGPQGTVLVLEDLHWADGGTLQLVTHLGRSERAGRLLIIGTYRESDLDPDHQLQRVLADLWRTATAVRLPLDGLDADDIRQQVATITGSPVPPASFAAVLTTATAGNPFFVGEVARHLTENRSVPQSAEEWDALDVETLAVPDRVRDVVRQRAAGLGSAVVEVLRFAAVIGREFPLSVLDRLEREHHDDVLGLVEQAASARLVDESPDPDRYRFHHALIGQALYEELSPGRRARLHRAIAEAMDTSRGSDPSEAARHWRLGAGASGHARAVESAERAGRVALASLAFEDARSEFGAALEQLDRFAPDDDRWRARLQLGLGDSLAALATDREARVEAYTLAAESASRADDPRSAALAALGLAGPPETMMQGGSFPIARLEEALDHLPDDEPGLRVHVLAALGAALSSTDAATATEEAALHERSDRLAAESIALARDIADEEALAFALRARLRTWFDPLAVRDRLVMADEVESLGRARGDRTLEAAGLTWSTIALAELGDRAGFAQRLERARTLVSEARDPFRSWMVSFRYVTLDLLDGDLDGAEARCDACLEQFGATAFAPFVEGLWGNQTFLIRFLQGRLDEVAWMLDLLPAGHTREILRAVVAARSDPDLARRTLDELVEQIDAVVAQRLTRSVLLAVFGLAAFESRHRAVAPALRAVVAPYLDTVIMLPPCAGSLGHMGLIAGLLAELDGDDTEATTLLDTALTANLAAANRPMAALTRFHTGRLLAPRDPAGGATIIRVARAEAAAIGMAGLVADCDRQLSGSR